MNRDQLRAKLESRRALYRAKRDRRSIGEEGSLNSWEKYDFAAEAIEMMAHDLGLALDDVDERQ